MSPLIFQPLLTLDAYSATILGSMGLPPKYIISVPVRVLVGVLPTSVLSHSAQSIIEEQLDSMALVAKLLKFYTEQLNWTL